MYGTDTTQAATLAATGVLGLSWNVLAAGVLILAGLTLLTIVRVVAHRRQAAQIAGGEGK